MAVSNSSGTLAESYAYTPFGGVRIFNAAGTEISATAIGNSILFTGRNYDAETGLYYYRARMYNPELGRFMQTDPIGYYDSMNLYQYCLNNPVNWIDPSGKSFLGKLWGVTKTVGVYLGKIAVGAASGAVTGGAIGLCVGGLPGLAAGAAAGAIGGGISTFGAGIIGMATGGGNVSWGGAVVTGGMSGLTGGAVAGVIEAGGTGFAAGAAGFITGGATGGVAAGMESCWDPVNTSFGFAFGAASGALAGGLGEDINPAVAAMMGVDSDWLGISIGKAGH